jgi:hypothetical protein
MKGFSEKWRHWISLITEDGNVGIKVNVQLGDYFQTIKGLRHGDPLSPILFNFGSGHFGNNGRMSIDRTVLTRWQGLYPILWKTIYQFYNMQMYRYFYGP